MKKTNLILNVVAILAIAVLYFLHFSGGGNNNGSDQKKTENENPMHSFSDSEVPIAYVNIDSLLNQMAMYKDLNESLTQKQQKMETNFGSEYRSFEREVVSFQEKVQKGLLTRKEAEELDSRLSNQRLELENRRNNYLMELQEENLVSQNKVIDYIMKYLKEYNSDNKYRFIFSYSFGGGLLYASDALDITSEVLVGINQKYASEKAPK